MAIAPRAPRLGPHHAVAGVAMLGHAIGRDRLSEARPARARIIFVGAVEQLVAAGGAAIDAIRLVVVVAARESGFGARFAQDVILRRAELLAPFGFGQVDGIHRLPLPGPDRPSIG